MTQQPPQPKDNPNPDNSGESALADMELYVSGLVNALDRGISEQTSPHNLSSLDYRLLRACLQRGECTATQLAVVLPTDPSRISRLVNTLVNMGLLSRRRLTTDRRVVMLSLTDEGNELISELDKSVQLYYRKLIQGVRPADLRVFAETCVKLAQNYESLRQP